MDKVVPVLRIIKGFGIRYMYPGKSLLDITEDRSLGLLVALL